MVIMPMAFFMVEYYMDMIFFVKQQWWLCFLTSTFAGLNVFLDYSRSQLFPNMGPTVPSFDWNNINAGIQPYQDAVMLVVLNSTIYLILTVASTYKTT